ncbi:hypothetical protein [Glycomyces buryatensis]|uniref:Uncharacterized protein n=1 Tax=Glycomyces buryatensis TaxID=2570927 RepID=A0A4S8QBL8_9ACTN|nr:hypothetical protein [Glycomyces buryatensis]THV40931.1 hypothetical protein FAB82_13865 [Glycomyces buryatensis]
MSNHATPEIPPGFSNMPGGGKFVVVLLWIRFGIGICAAIGLGATNSALSDNPGAQELLPDWFGTFVAFSVIQTIIWVILYAVFAVKLTQRSSSARTGTLVLEIVGLALTGLSYALMQGTYSNLAEHGADFTGTYIGSGIGLVLSLIVIGILVSNEMKQWCDR